MIFILDHWCLWGKCFDARLKTEEVKFSLYSVKKRKPKNRIIVLCQESLYFPGKESIDGRAKIALKNGKNKPIDFKENKDWCLSGHDTSARQAFLRFGNTKLKSARTSLSL